ncbi:MAG: TMEM165/GDT1 family protein [Deltaproteobacteria bacterium]
MTRGRGRASVRAVLAAAASAFALIFVAELGDKTLLAVLLLSARYRPLPILLGACSAFLLHTSIAVGLGQLFAFLPPAFIRGTAAALFALFGVLLIVQRPEEAGDVSRGAHRPFATAFLVIFLAEWGDMTQILTAALTGKASAALGRLAGGLSIFAGATLGLWAGTLLAVAVGRTVGKRLPERAIRIVAGGAFLAFAALTAVGKGV